MSEIFTHSPSASILLDKEMAKISRFFQLARRLLR